MVIDNTKSSYSLPLLIILPLRKIKNLFQKVEANFLTGIIIGALLSLLVNILTNQIGEDITKQKSLEALEIELVNQHLQAVSIINNYNHGDYKKSKFYYYNPKRFDNYIWRSLGSTTFFYSLPPTIQGELIAYYSNSVDGTNNVYSNIETVVNDYSSKYITCVFDGSKDCTAQEVTSNNVITFYTQIQAQYATSVDKSVTNILKDFHPTRDRLSNPILSRLMGNKGLPILLLPWKK